MPHSVADQVGGAFSRGELFSRADARVVMPTGHDAPFLDGERLDGRDLTHTVDPCAMRSSVAMRSAIGGCVSKSRWIRDS